MVGLHDKKCSCIDIKRLYYEKASPKSVATLRV